MKFGGYFFSLFFFVIINFNCSITVCIPLALLEMRHSECEMVSTGSFFSAQGDRKGPALVYKLTHTHSVLSWMSSPSQCSECDCAMSTPCCHDYTLKPFSHIWTLDNVRSIRSGHCAALPFHTCTTQQEIVRVRCVLIYCTYLQLLRVMSG